MRAIVGSLVVTATAVALLAGCGSGGGTTIVETITTAPTPGPPSGDTVDKNPPPTTETVPPAVQTTPAPTLPVFRHQSFQTPSRNIGCVLLGVARCDIRKRDWRAPPRPASCNLGWSQGVSVGTTGSGRIVCAGDTSLDPSAPVLRYGTIDRYEAFDCLSRIAGITCRNRTTGHGFFLARDRYRLF